MINQDLDCKLNFKPTQILKLKFEFIYGSDLETDFGYISEDFKEYLNTHSLDGLQTEVEFDIDTEDMNFDL